MATRGGPQLNPESRLLLALAAGDTDGLERVDLASVDRGRFGALAHRHQVAALCHWQLGRMRAGGSPVVEEAGAALDTGLKHAFAHHTLRNSSLVRDLADLRRTLAERGVDFLVFKGPWLAHCAYPDPGTRPIDDIDLCVREDDLSAGVAALYAVGYTSPEPLPTSPADALRRAHFGKQLRFLAPGRRPVELHFRMINVGPPASEDWVRSGRRALILPGREPVEIAVPGPEAMLMHLALHANQHGFSALRLLFDLRFTLARIGEDLDVETFLARVRGLRCSASVYFALQLASELVGARVSPELLGAVRPPAWKRTLFNSTWGLKRVRNLESFQRANETEAPRLYLLEMGRLSDKLRYLRGIAEERGGHREIARAAIRSLRAPR